MTFAVVLHTLGFLLLFVLGFFAGRLHALGVRRPRMVLVSAQKGASRFAGNCQRDSLVLDLVRGRRAQRVEFARYGSHWINLDNGEALEGKDDRLADILFERGVAERAELDRLLAESSPEELEKLRFDRALAEAVRRGVVR